MAKNNNDKSTNDKIEILVDPSNKSVEVKVNGKVLEDVSNVFISTVETGGFFAVEVSQRQKVGNMTKLTRIIAKNHDKIKDYITKDSEIAGFAEVDDDVKSQISNYIL